jgi:hypothetical protein
MCGDNKVDVIRKGWEGEEENPLVHNEYIIQKMHLIK